MSKEEIKSISVPPSYKGYKVELVGPESSDYSVGAVAGARQTKEGIPYIAIFRTPEGLEEDVLAHEWGHHKLDLGRGYTHLNTWRDEVSAERLGTSTRRGHFGLSNEQLANILIPMLHEWAEDHEGLPIGRRNFTKLKEFLVRNSEIFGLTKKEALRAFKCLESFGGYAFLNISDKIEKTRLFEA